MGKMGSKWLDVNDVFPELRLRLISGDEIKLPQDTGGGYCVLLI